MPTDALTFVVDPAAPPELALAAAGLAAGLLELGHPCDVLVDPWPETLAGRTTLVDVGSAEHRGDRWRLEAGAESDLALIDPSGRSFPVPFSLPLLLPRRKGRPRLFVIGGDAARRTRLLVKLFDELRSRPGCDVIVWRDLPDEMMRQRYDVQIHAEVNSVELARLVGSADVLVEVTDEPLPEARLLGALGRAGGIPTVVPAGFRGARWAGTVDVREWGGEAFADAAIAAAKLGRDESAAAAARKEAAERLAGALHS